MTQCFAVRIGIDTPISLRGLLHLDGLLGALLTARGGRLDDIPLDRVHGTWTGSAALLETGPFGAVTVTDMRVKRVGADGIPAGILDHLPAGQRRIGEMHPMRARLTPYACLEGVRAVWFAAGGNKEQTLDLLSDARNLGAMGRTGWGRITDIRDYAINDDAKTGLVLTSGLPARILPLGTWRELGLPRPEAAIVSLQRATPPYWTGEEVPCLSPLQVDMMGTAAEIRDLMGIFAE